MPSLPLRRPLLATLLVLCASPAAVRAQAGAAPEPATPSRISAVTLYPGSATVERTARVPAGSTRAVFDCLPAQLDARSLQVQAAGAVRVGDIGVQVHDRALAGRCAGPREERLRALQEQLAAAQAETGALELAHSYLKSVAGNAPGTPATSGPGTPSAGQIGATTEALRRSAHETLARLHQARSRQQLLEQQVQALAEERERGGSARARVATVTVALAADQGAELRLRYQVRGPGWSPSYRATLDTAAARGASAPLQLERLALVAQDTGEDWTDVALTLSTGQPLRASGGPLPRPWTVDVQPERREPPAALPAAAPAPALLAERARAGGPADAGADAAPADFTVAVAEGAYATTFAVPQRVSVPSGGAQVALALQAQRLDAQLLTRTTPALDPTAYLVAQLPALPGAWPAGPVALYRDGAYVGQGTLDAAQAAPLGLSFGRDERVEVTAEPEQRHSASGGLTGARTERTTERSYVVTNRHARAVALQVLDAAPVSLDAQIQVQSHYEPTPAELAWRAQPGTVAWTQVLDSGASARFTARHTLRHDKELRLRERR